MTYSLDTLNNRLSSAPLTPGGVRRFAHEVGLILGLIGLVFWMAALVSYSSQDGAWSTSGTAHATAAASAVTRNWGGRLGAWLADVSYFLLGFSVWWVLAAGLRGWLASLARWLRGEPVPNPGPLHSSRLKFWLALVLLLGVSTALEWSRLYRF